MILRILGYRFKFLGKNHFLKSTKLLFRHNMKALRTKSQA